MYCLLLLSNIKINIHVSVFLFNQSGLSQCVFVYVRMNYFTSEIYCEYYIKYILIQRQHIHKVVLVYLILGRIVIWQCQFLRRGENRSAQRKKKTLGAKERTNNKLNPHMASMLGFEPRPHWWEASALTIVPSLAHYCSLC